MKVKKIKMKEKELKRCEKNGFWFGLWWLRL